MSKTWSIRTRQARRRARRGQPPRRKRHKARLLYLFARHGGRCALCSTRCELSFEPIPTQATCDHIIPLSRGGAEDPSNWQLACLKCNAAKGNRMPDNEGSERRV
jgi:5-methylcytosine-specific restriction endonuclease McrA